MESNKPKVFIVTDWYYPGYKAGGPITSVYNMVQSLGQDIDFKIYTRNTDWFDSTPYALASDQWLPCENALVYYSSGGHIQKLFSIISNLESDSILYVNGFYSPIFSLLPMLLGMLSKKPKGIIVAPRGMLNKNAIAIKPFRKKLIISLLRILGLEKKALFHSASNNESSQIHQVYTQARIKLAENLPKKIVASNNPGRVGFINVGRISEVKNSLKMVKLFSAFSELEFCLIGTTDDQNYQALCNENASKNTIFIPGLNPKEVGEKLESAKFYISMTSGENFGHAIIEAMASGCPVIISDKTPWSDLESFGAGWVIALDDDLRWKSVISEASSMAEEDYQQMSDRAKEYVSSKLNFDEIRQQYFDLFSE